MKNKYEALELLAQDKIPVFPVHGILKNGDCTCKLMGNCPQKGKHPLFENWLEAMTINFNFIRSWRPNLNYGIPTGLISKLIVVEVDRTKGGSDSMAYLQNQIGNISNLRINSDRDHFELYFKYNDVCKLIFEPFKWDGITFKVDNDWVIGPYSQIAKDHLKLPDLDNQDSAFNFKTFSSLYPVSDEIYSLTKWRDACN